MRVVEGKPVKPLVISERKYKKLVKKVSKKKSLKREVFLFAISFSFVILAGAFTFYVYGIKSAEVEFELVGEEMIELQIEDDYIDQGVIAKYCFLTKCEDVSRKVEISVSDAEGLLEKKVGEYTISYKLDYGEHKLEKIRTVYYGDNTAPVITLNGDKNIGVRVYQGFEDPGFSATDNADGDLTAKVEVSGGVDTGRSGVYQIFYNVSDSSGNTTTEVRNVFVYEWYAAQTTATATFEDLTNYITANGWDISYGFRNFEKDYYYTFQGDKIYYGASLVKTVDAMYVYERLDPIPYRALVRNAITYSNNGAHIQLANTIGVGNLQTYAEEIGMKHHLKGSSIYSDTYYFCDTTVEDQLAAWKHLWELINSNPRGEELKWYFINNFWDNLRFNGSPTHMYKNGLYGNNYHEVGIMFADSPYEVAILSTEGWRWNSTTIMKDLSHRIYMINQILP